MEKHHAVAQALARQTCICYGLIPKPVRSWLLPDPCGAFLFFWGEIWDSNPRPSGPQPDALTNCANPTIFSGVPWGIRTLDLLLRRQLLYPTELKAHQRSNSTLLPAWQEAKLFVERVMGIEPTRPAWKAGILPLNYTRIPCDGLSNRYSSIIPHFFSFVKSFLKILLRSVAVVSEGEEFRQNRGVFCRLPA